MDTNVYDIIRKYYPENEFALMREVRNGAGFSANRSADYMAMNLWPSRGLSLHGIEQKSFRSDWTKELKSPEKADAFFKYCDFWWLLTTEDNVAKIDEIPEQWGWMHIVKGKIKIIKQAPKLTPAAIDRGILVSMLKRAVCKDGFIRADTIEERIKQAKLEAENSKNYQYDRLNEKYTILQKQFNEFRQFTGIDIGNTDSWRQPNMEKIGAAVDFIAKDGHKKILTDLETMSNTSERIVAAIKTGIDSLKSLNQQELAT